MIRKRKNKQNTYTKTLKKSNMCGKSWKKINKIKTPDQSFFVHIIHITNYYKNILLIIVIVLND